MLCSLPICQALLQQTKINKKIAINRQLHTPIVVLQFQHVRNSFPRESTPMRFSALIQKYLPGSSPLMGDLFALPVVESFELVAFQCNDRKTESRVLWQPDRHLFIQFRAPT